MKTQTKEQLTVSVQNSRIAFDEIANAIDSLPKSRGKALATTALQKGRMYLGEIALRLGADIKYDHSNVKEAKDIPEATDKAEKSTFLTKGEVNDILAIRKEIEDKILIIDVVVGELNADNLTKGIEKFKLDCDISESYRSLKEVRMWLGVRLGELRDQAKDVKV